MTYQQEWQHNDFFLKTLQLENGATLQSVNIAYVTRGKLNAGKSNAILVLHGYTSSHKFVCNDSKNAAEGSWAPLIGPGKAIDTDQYFVIAPNALGSCFGSTGPKSANPLTGRPYGPDFPRITFGDIVSAQYQLACSLGIRRFVAVIGVSMGGFAAWQWGIQYPGAMSGLGIALSSLSGRHVVPQGPNSSLSKLLDDPHWNNGWVYDDDKILPALRQLRIETLTAYNATSGIQESAARWATEFDPNTLIVLAHAMRNFDATPQLGRLAAKVFFMLASSDRIFPSKNAAEVLNKLTQHSVPYQYFELETEYGHQSSGKEWYKWEKALAQFLARLDQTI